MLIIKARKDGPGSTFTGMERATLPSLTTCGVVGEMGEIFTCINSLLVKQSIDHH